MPILDRELLEKALPQLELTEAAFARMECYANSLLEMNKHMNLTAISSPREVTLKHFADSLSLLCVHEFPQGAAVLDLGTGGGFPGVPLLLARPDLSLCFLDSTRKKLRFIEQALAEQGISARFIHARAEELGRRGGAEYGKYDLVTARAVAALGTLCTWAMPFLRSGGCLLAMKGPGARDELLAAKRELSRAGVKDTQCIKIPLPEECGERYLVKLQRT